MTTIKLIHKSGATIATLPKYSNLYEVPLSNAIDFLVASRPLHASADGDNEGGETLNVARIIARSVCAFYSLDLKTIINAIGVEDEGEVIAFQTLFVHIANLLSSFSGGVRSISDGRFALGGETFVINALAARTLTALPNLPHGLTVQEAIEAYEVARIAQLRQQDGDADGSALYTYYLNLCAVLLRKEGEELPLSEAELDDFIQSRTQFFHTLPLSAGVALDVDFFFGALMKPSEQTRAAVGSLSNLLFNLALATARVGKPKSRRTPTPSSAQKQPSSVSGGATFTPN